MPSLPSWVRPHSGPKYRSGPVCAKLTMPLRTKASLGRTSRRNPHNSIFRSVQRNGITRHIPLRAQLNVQKQCDVVLKSFQKHIAILLSSRIGVSLNFLSREIDMKFVKRARIDLPRTRKKQWSQREMEVMWTRRNRKILVRRSLCHTRYAKLRLRKLYMCAAEITTHYSYTSYGEHMLNRPSCPACVWVRCSLFVKVVSLVSMTDLSRTRSEPQNWLVCDTL